MTLQSVLSSLRKSLTGRRQQYLSHMEYDIFISYRNEDGAYYAQIFASELNNLGYRVFFSQNDVYDGEYEAFIDSAIQSARVFIMMLTPKYLERLKEDSIIGKELKNAIKHEKAIIPIDPNHMFNGVPQGVPLEIQDVINRTHHSIIYFGDSTFKPTFEAIVKNRIAPKFPIPKDPILKKWIIGCFLACFVLLVIILGYFAEKWPDNTDSLFEELGFKNANEEDGTYKDAYLLEKMKEEANRGDVSATYWLGRHYLFKGELKDALDNFRKIKDNDSKASFWVGNFDFRGFKNPKTGDWVNSPDAIGGKAEIVSAAQKGDSRALCWMGFLYISKNYPTSFNLDSSYNSFLKSAKKGNPVAQYMIGEFYEKGWGGKQQNKKLAEKCRNYAIKNGYKTKDDKSNVNVLTFYIINNLTVDTAKIERESAYAKKHVSQ